MTHTTKSILHLAAGCAVLALGAPTVAQNAPPNSGAERSNSRANRNQGAQEAGSENTGADNTNGTPNRGRANPARPTAASNATNQPGAANDAANQNEEPVLSGEQRLLQMLAEEEAKYRRRLAQLDRIEAIAKEKDNAALLARVTAIRTKLDEHYERTMSGLRQRFGHRDVDRGLNRVQNARGGRPNNNAMPGPAQPGPGQPGPGRPGVGANQNAAPGAGNGRSNPAGGKQNATPGRGNANQGNGQGGGG